jgi:hypothetical protein
MKPAPDAGRDLAARREVLLARSARLRDEIADDVRGLQRGAGLLDRGVGLLDRGMGLLGGHRSRRGPGLLVPLAAAAGLLLVLRRPSRAVRLATRALAFWPLVRPLVPTLRTYLASRRAAAGSAPPRP